MPDAATASAASRNGEVAWWDIVNVDQVPLLNKTPGVATGFGNRLGKPGPKRAGIPEATRGLIAALSHRGLEALLIGLFGEAAVLKQTVAGQR